MDLKTNIGEVSLDEIPKAMVYNNVNQTQNEFRNDILGNEHMSIYQKKKQIASSRNIVNRFY